MINYEEAKKRLSLITDIELCEDEYISWSYKAKFYDKIEKDYFWGIPYNVLSNKSVHPNRRIKTQKLTYKDAKQRFVDQGRTDIELCEDGFKGWSIKSKFYDKIRKNYFWSIPADVYKSDIKYYNKTKKEKFVINFKEAKQRFVEQGRTDIEICEETYLSWSRDKCKFYDKIEKDYFWSTPVSVYGQNVVHPNRSKKTKIDYKTAKQKFIDQGRTDIELCEDGFVGWKKKSKFYDKEIKDYFFAIPAGVYSQKSSHPKNKYIKAKNTIIKLHGEHHFNSKIIKNKRLKTMKEKYGVLYPYQSKIILNKVKKTNKQKYGVEYSLQSNIIRNKIKITCLKKYGVKNFANSKQSIELNKLRLTKYYILETNESVINWLNKQPEPKPAYTTLIQYIQKNKYKDLIPETFLLNFIKNFIKNKSCLESIFDSYYKNCFHNKYIGDLKYKPDFKLSDKIYVNVDGLYWHSEKIQKDKNYHFNLRKSFEENKLRIFQFREDEIYNKFHIIKSIVDNSLNKTKDKIYARKCVIKTLKQKEADIFLSNNHLMGSIKAKHVGLYFNNKLISIMSYKCKKNICKIERFCSLINTNIIGAFNKLLNYIENNCCNIHITEIHNWVDLRYGTGDHLLNKKFVFVKETVGWKWTNFNETFNRLQCKANMDNRKLSEKDYANELKWYKIYDAGQRLYIKYF